MKKGKFYITNRNFTEENIFKTQVSGYIDTENNIGYDRRNGDSWYSTDIATGLSIITNAPTRKECEEQTHKCWSKVEKIRKGDRYEKLLKIYHDAIIINETA